MAERGVAEFELSRAISVDDPIDELGKQGLSGFTFEFTLEFLIKSFISSFTNGKKNGVLFRKK